MSKTLAIHWTATTHGTWLHGDRRGSWRFGRLIDADLGLERESQGRMTRQATRLDADDRQSVAAAFGEALTEHRQRAFAATVQATHVHLVLAPLREDIRKVIARLKHRSTMALRANSPAILAGVTGIGQDGRTTWTAGRYYEFIFDERHLANLIEYVRDHNRRSGLPADPFDWIEPLYPAANVAGERVRSSDTNVSLRIT